MKAVADVVKGSEVAAMELKEVVRQIIREST